jgi:MFS family permease
VIRRFCAVRIAAGFAGTVIEWYDFIIFGTVSVLVFSKVFYPEQTPFIALLSSLGTFAVGFVARPLGGIFFGYLGESHRTPKNADRHPRRNGHRDVVDRASPQLLEHRRCGASP